MSRTPILPTAAILALLATGALADQAGLGPWNGAAAALAQQSALATSSVAFIQSELPNIPRRGIAARNHRGRQQRRHLPAEPRGPDSRAQDGAAGQARRRGPAGRGRGRARPRRPAGRRVPRRARRRHGLPQDAHALHRRPRQRVRRPPFPTRRPARPCGGQPAKRPEAGRHLPPGVWRAGRTRPARGARAGPTRGQRPPRGRGHRARRPHLARLRQDGRVPMERGRHRVCRDELRRQRQNRCLGRAGQQQDRGAPPDRRGRSDGARAAAGIRHHPGVCPRRTQPGRGVQRGQLAPHRRDPGRAGTRCSAATCRRMRRAGCAWRRCGRWGP